jgi:hypothetical protein
MAISREPAGFPLRYGFGDGVGAWALLPLGLTGTIESSKVKTYMPIAISIKPTTNHVRQFWCSLFLLDSSLCMVVLFPLAECAGAACLGCRKPSQTVAILARQGSSRPVQETERE